MKENVSRRIIMTWVGRSINTVQKFQERSFYITLSEIFTQTYPIAVDALSSEYRTRVPTDYPGSVGSKESPKLRNELIRNGEDEG